MSQALKQAMNQAVNESSIGVVGFAGAIGFARVVGFAGAIDFSGGRGILNTSGSKGAGARWV